MVHTACLVVDVSSVSSCCKNVGTRDKHIYSPGPLAFLAHLTVSLPCLRHLLTHLFCLSEFFANLLFLDIYGMANNCLYYGFNRLIYCIARLNEKW